MLPTLELVKGQMLLDTLKRVWYVKDLIVKTSTFSKATVTTVILEFPETNELVEVPLERVTSHWTIVAAPGMIEEIRILEQLFKV